MIMFPKKEHDFMKLGLK